MAERYWEHRWRDERAENERLKVERAGDQQRLFHYETIIAARDERCNRLEAEIEDARLARAQLLQDYATLRAEADRLLENYNSLKDIVESMRLETPRQP